MTDCQKHVLRIFIYIFLNIAGPVLTVYVSVHSPNETKLSITVVGLLTLCWINTNILVFEHYRSASTHKKESNRLIDTAKDHFDRALQPLHEEVTCLKNIHDSEPLDQLSTMVKLHNELAKKNRFTTSDVLNDFLVTYHMKTYVKALHQVVYNQRVPLPSEPRLEAAIKAIRNAREILSVNTDIGQWYRDHEQYQEANIEAAAHATIKRVFVIKEKTDLVRLDGIIRRQQDAGIAIKVVMEAKVLKATDHVSHEKMPIVNMLICDNNYITCSFVVKNIMAA